jgi:hypothetical protein
VSRWLPDDGLVTECIVCDDGPDFFETDDQPGWEGMLGVVCAVCESVYDARTGQLLDEGNA